MTKISEIGNDDLLALERMVQLKTRGARTFAEAAQAYMNLLWERLEPSLVLARLFVTVPFRALPETNRAFAIGLAKSAGTDELIRDDTLVVSLVGSRGCEPAWNDWRTSRGHVGIPLASASFVEAIPMMARLLKQMGVGLDWIDRRDTALVTKTVGTTAGVFYVGEARDETDLQGRKVIAAQDFVERYGVRTVFGLGGGFVGTSTFMISIAFCREPVARKSAEAFMPHVNRLKASTMLLVKEGKILES